MEKQNKCIVQFFCNGDKENCEFGKKDPINRTNDPCFYFYDGMCSNEEAQTKIIRELRLDI